jgi:hypothetical protein
MDGSRYPRQLRHPQTPQGDRLARPSSPLDVPLHAHLRQLAQRRRGFFAILTRRRLKRGVFRGVVDLQTAINCFVVDHNQQSKSFVWTADPDKIIAAAARGHQVLESIR